jgi:serine/threonine protein kinase
MKLWRYGHAIEYLGQRYRLEGSLGSGGMADVCLAWDEHEDCEVAIKVIKSDQLEQRTLDRFIKEAAQVARWQHPNILRIYSDLKLELLDASQGSIVPYIVMEYAQGGDLHKRLTPGEPYPFAATLDLFAQLCSAVAYAHEHGVIHRDLKPLNILFRRLPGGSEQVVLSDFGLAVEADATHHTFAHGGTLLYMAPEQFRGHALPASDIFALGVIFYQLCTGQLPFRRNLQELHRLNSAVPTPPSFIVPALPEALDDVVLTALAADPEQRYPGANALWEAIHAVVYSKHLRPAYSTIPRRNTSSSGPRPAIGRRTAPQRAIRPISPGSEQQQAQTLPPAAVPHIAAPNSFSAQLELAADSQDLPPPSSNPALHTSHTQLRQPASQIDDPDIGIFEPSYSHGILPAIAQGKSIGSEQSNSQQNKQSRQRKATQGQARPAPYTSAALRPTVYGERGRAGFGASIKGPDQPGGALRSPSLHGHAVQPPSRPKRPIYRIGALTLLLIMLCAGAMLASLIYFAPAHSVLNMLPNPATIMGGTTVTITPASQRIANTYTILAITNGTPDANQRQIAARTLSAQQAQTKTINGTGHNQVPATAAKGIVTFTNGSANTFTVAAGSLLPAGNGVSVTIDTPAVIPAANPPNLGKITVPAHTTTSGANANIPPNSVNGTCCTTGNFIYARNTAAFTGGQDAKNYTFVQKSDVDAFVNAVKPQLMQQANNALSAQLQAGEQLAQPAACQANVQNDNPIGDQGQNIPSTNAAVTVTCKATAYDQNGLRSLVTNLLQQQASVSIGPHYALQGPITVHTQNQQINQDNSVTLLIDAYGTWIYQFSSDQRQQLARLIAGKSADAARMLLEQQAGIRNVTIATSSGVLPSDVGKIDVEVQGE